MRTFLTLAVEPDGSRVSVSTRILQAVGAEHIKVPVWL